MLNSAAAVRLPCPVTAPPITTSRATRCGRVGSSRSASARLVSGPSATSNSRPACSCESRRIASAACSALAWRSLGTYPVSPNPSAPCTSAASSQGCTSGPSQPGNTGTASWPATSHSFSALPTVCDKPTLPATIDRPTTRWAGSLNAISKARASSTPGAVSMSSGIGSGMSPASCMGAGQSVTAGARGQATASGGGEAGRAAYPARDQPVGGPGGLFQQFVGQRLDARQQVGVAGEVGQAELGQSGLAGTQHFAGATQLQVALGDQEPVVGLAHGFQAQARGLRQRRLV